MNRRLLSILAISLLIVPLGGLSDSQAGRPITEKDLRGSYGFSWDGQLLAGPFVGPVAAVGIITADGRGNITAVRTLNVTGTLVLQQTGDGTYQVNPDGSGTAEFTITTVSPPGFPDNQETFAFAYNRRQDNVPFLATSPGVVAQGVAWRQ